MMLHLTTLGLLAALVLPTPPREERIIQGGFIDTVVEASPVLESTLDLQDVAPAPESSDSSFETQLTDLAVPESVALAAISLHALTSPLELSDVGTPTGSLTEAIGSPGGFSSGQHPGIGNGGNGTSNGPGGSGFFGLNVKGKRVVFVVDASSSMNMPHPGPMKTRFNRVKLELLRTVSAMTEKEQFFITFFGDGAIPMHANSLVEAEPGMKQRHLTWMAKVKATGNTYPEQALLLALQLQPDIIYFLTDGEFDHYIVPGVTAANVQRIPIHTIGFSDQRGESLLREIAKLNDGTYTYIPPDENLSADESAKKIISSLSQ